MRTDLLLRGAELLEADAAKPDGVRFDLGAWVMPYDQTRGVKKDFETKPEEIPMNCGTSACAMGLFCLSGAFKNEGLSHTFRPRCYTGSFLLVPTFNYKEEFDAAVALFEITDEQAYRLFSPEAYRKTKGAVAELEVASRMRALAAGEDIGCGPDDDYDGDDEDYDAEDEGDED